MANAEKLLTEQADKFGRVWFPPTSLRELISQDRVRISGTDNGMIIEVDGEAWSAPDAFRLSSFPDTPQ